MHYPNSRLWLERREDAPVEAFGRALPDARYGCGVQKRRVLRSEEDASPNNVQWLWLSFLLASQWRRRALSDAEWPEQRVGSKVERLNVRRCRVPRRGRSKLP